MTSQYSATVLKKLRRMTKDELVEQIIKLSIAFDKQKVANVMLMEKIQVAVNSVTEEAK